MMVLANIGHMKLSLYCLSVKWRWWYENVNCNRSSQVPVSMTTMIRIPTWCDNIIIWPTFPHFPHHLSTFYCPLHHKCAWIWGRVERQFWKSRSHNRAINYFTRLIRVDFSVNNSFCWCSKQLVNNNFSGWLSRILSYIRIVRRVSSLIKMH